MKKNKLKLADIKVKSFVTEVSAGAEVKGGAISADCLKTIPAAQCISGLGHSFCRTCEFQCGTDA